MYVFNPKHDPKKVIFILMISMEMSEDQRLKSPLGLKMCDQGEEVNRFKEEQLNDVIVYYFKQTLQSTYYVT